MNVGIDILFYGVNGVGASLNNDSAEGKGINMKKLYSNKLTIFLFLFPGLLLFVGVLIAPIFASAYYSLFDWNLFGTKKFIGFQNYKDLFTKDNLNFITAVKNASLLAVLSVFIQLPFALFLALMIGNGKRRFERGFLSVFFMPVLISTVVIGQLWVKIYNPDYGVLRAIIDLFHGNPSKTGLLGDSKYALWAAFVPTLWQYVGYHMLLMYAAIKSVPPEYREAAMIDGANEMQTNIHIVLPYIKPILKISVIFAVTGSFKSYDLIYILTQGGPNHASEVPSTVMIRMLFSSNKYGMGSAIAFLMILMCFAAALIIGAVFKDKEA